ncbi:hydroxysteroid 11-beta-dehydrogenase 1-like protein isoform X6 [Ailuropoda melanoleuca]|nr:hydroxysteroid 11-beta-dehydrogenase 1-like protein isoform X6 [Ailuropoda melanoleuca]XP_034513479.1 hydroxysteroid 11-beta-dehydrogenase 1-like protein isoform X6 [Ailuropoda melanoleuca]
MASPEVPGRVVQFALDKLGGLDYLVLNHLGATPAGTRSRSVQATRWLLQVPRPTAPSAPYLLSPGSTLLPIPTSGPAPPRPRPPHQGPASPGLEFLRDAVTRSRHLQVNFLSYVQLTSLALPSLTDSKGSLVVVSSLLGHVPTSFSSPYSAAKFALDGFFGSLRRELDVQDVNVAITMCILGLRDRASTAEEVRGVARAKAAPGPKAALAVIRGGATRAPGVFYPRRLHLLGLLRGWLPHPKAWFIRQELNVTAAATA